MRLFGSRQFFGLSAKKSPNNAFGGDKRSGALTQNRVGLARRLTQTELAEAVVYFLTKNISCFRFAASRTD
jgi:hypothetical protein